ncbi:hypothetical protein [Rhizobium sp. AN80A]|uniref:hypothetical protein n=1 Tax=Rhizobium sp. AN80A TaxID=3040673 RepID=UPI0024B3693C|nr:hypothetical protein [Rhizobium sp. AN80A]
MGGIGRYGLLIIHALIWVILMGAAYAKAGPYKFASCWQIIPIYFPPLGMVMMAIGAFGAFVLLLSVVIKPIRSKGYFRAARHAVIFTLGWNGCSLAAYMAVGQVSCL